MSRAARWNAPYDEPLGAAPVPDVPFMGMFPHQGKGLPHKIFTPEEYESFRDFLEQACGIMLGDNKHYLVVSRLGPVMAQYSLSSLGELMGRLKNGRTPGLRERIIEAMTTNETFWFRDGYPFETLKQRILPELVQKGVRPLRIWSAACSSGQEPYSISMAVHEYTLSRPGVAIDVQILATDISSAVLNEGKAGLYDAQALTRGLSEERRQRFFQSRGERWEVVSEIRARVTWREQNLLQSFALLGRFDAIFCRNALIYFSTACKRDIITRLAKAMSPGGYLILGAAESLVNHSDAFEMLRCHPGVMYRLR